MRQGLNMSNGTYTGLADYSAFGEVIGGNNTGASQSVYQWGAQSGYRMDGSSGGGGDCGLVKVGARYYDPAVGRFTSRDSDIAEPAYLYCWGDPINLTDDDGHSPAAAAIALRVGGLILLDPPAAVVVGIIVVGVVVVGAILLAHSKGRRASTKDDHEKGTSRLKRDQNGSEDADAARRAGRPNRRPEREDREPKKPGTGAPIQNIPDLFGQENVTVTPVYDPRNY